MFINWKLLNSSTIISSGIISFNFVNNGISKIWFIKLVVVVFPSLPVIPIILQGANFINCSISVVTIAPLLISATNSGFVGKQLGDLNIKSNPIKFFKFSLPK